jgi:uncharacterized protein YdhG (YjbR/CyaY superfamily)
METFNETIPEYLANIPAERQDAFKKLYATISENLPKGFQEGISYGMIGWSVPLETYPAGYHCTPGSPLPFLNLASQKNFIALYHMGIYADEELLNWFVTEYPKHCKRKLDMGKSCIRFKKPEEIPFELIAALVQKMSPKDWISLYESKFKK